MWIRTLGRELGVPVPLRRSSQGMLRLLIDVGHVLAYFVGRISRLCVAALLLSMCNGPVEPSDLVGAWGGEHVEVTFDSAGAGTVQYDCAHGRIAAPIAISAAGELSASGEHVREHGGPTFEGEVPDAHPARYAGELRGDRLTFTVTLTDSGTVLGPYTVRRGQPAQLFRCL